MWACMLLPFLPGRGWIGSPGHSHRGIQGLKTSPSLGSEDRCQRWVEKRIACLTLFPQYIKTEMSGCIFSGTVVWLRNDIINTNDNKS